LIEYCLINFLVDWTMFNQQCSINNVQSTKKKSTCCLNKVQPPEMWQNKKIDRMYIDPIVYGQPSITKERAPPTRNIQKSKPGTKHGSMKWLLKKNKYSLPVIPVTSMFKIDLCANTVAWPGFRCQHRQVGLTVCALNG